MTNGWPAPASRRTRCQWGRSDGLGAGGRRFSQEGSDLKRGQQQRVAFASTVDESPKRSQLSGRRCLLKGRQPGSASHLEDFISNLRSQISIPVLRFQIETLDKRLPNECT